MREELLQAKSEEISKELTHWARANNVLRAGEKIVFYMRVEAEPIVVRGEANDKPFHPYISAQLKAYWDFFFPVELSAAEIEELLGLITERDSKEWMEDLLLRFGNMPTTLPGLNFVVFRQINRRLKKSLRNGRRFHLVKDVKFPPVSRAQLWEVQKKK